MNITVLRHFVELSETLHFGRASARANISTSALSRHIRQLEAELNVALFDRDNRTVELTPAGIRFQRYARDAVQQWDQIRFELTDPADHLRGEISLYCSVTASHSILFDLLNRFRPAHPGVEIRLQTGDPEYAIARVQALEEDLAIAARPATLPAGVRFKPIRVSPLVFIEQVENKARFEREYSEEEGAAPMPASKPADYQHLFDGNNDDCFRCPLRLTRKAAKLYAPFYKSGLVIASPLGIRLATGADGESKRDIDWLSSIEVVLAGYAAQFGAILRNSAQFGAIL